ncbi:aminoacyl-histidine dipeptidase [candidate division WOR-1 bacterium DG_54_3]|uniref:Cytosol non-specific dipeptidase n=1 Tax=candidate division WOR-1 bacterium DG_54_3 TaxID=1703775 RepID=A0A0S7Y3M4_UNCSA|nr:MAG: aminoacyl-histidine dipeptidase [candidate division WOR-1 bacterium DG_54_3]
MSAIFEGLKPSLIWKYFEKILTIPRCSGNEKAIGDYIMSVAKELNLTSKRDKVGNVVVEKKAAPGHEGSETVILQGHLDMVCEKNSDVEHDFSKDPIQAEIKEGWIQAQGTTLGSDNGIGVAASLAVMEDESLLHGPLEFLFTVDEETGLTGATKIESDFLKGKKLLNLDSEDEGTFTIGCAGGADSEIVLPLKREKIKGGELTRLKIFGLRGGHSGLDINQGRGNAIKLLARLLWQASKEFQFGLIRIEGGNKRNAIPRESEAELLIEPAQFDALFSFFQKAYEKIQNEYKVVEKETKFSFEKIEGDKENPLSSDSHRALVNLLLALPHGVIAMHPEIEELVETSTNLAIIHTHKDQSEIICSSRSSVASALEAARNMIAGIGELVQAKLIQPEGYPGWMPNLDSPLLKILKDIYLKVFQKEPEVEAVHAGLECGIIGEKFMGMDMISFGPTIEHPHSPEERINIDSVEKFWKFLAVVLEELA